MSSQDIADQVARAIEMRERGRDEEAREILLRLHQEHPRDPVVNLQCASIHDKLGLERVPTTRKRSSWGSRRKIFMELCSVWEAHIGHWVNTREPNPSSDSASTSSPATKGFRSSSQWPYTTTRTARELASCCFVSWRTQPRRSRSRDTGPPFASTPTISIGPGEMLVSSGDTRHGGAET